MRSGTGRHRRPRQAPAVVVAAGVTGAGIALPFMAASGAQAADGAVWDRVAECESGGAWSANDGSGYYGGFQLTLGTWEEYGGTEHADRPDLASRGQQIAVAEAILAAEGPDAWPACAVTSGLTASVNGVTEAPGVPEADRPGPAEREAAEQAAPSPGATAPGRSEERPVPDGGAPSGTPRPEATDARPAERPVPDATGTLAPDVDGTDGGTGAPAEGPEGAEGAEPGDTSPPGASAPPEGAAPGSAAPEGARTGGATGEGAGRHRGAPDPRETDAGAADRGAARHAAPAERTVPADAATEYRVAEGDSLSGIASEHAVEGGWPALYEANASLIGADPDLILPGQSIELPAAQG